MYKGVGKSIDIENASLIKSYVKAYEKKLRNKINRLKRKLKTL